MISIASKNHRTPPNIDPKFLSEVDDLDRLVTALRQLEHIFRQPAFERLSPRPIIDVAGFNRTQLDDYVRNNADTAYHPVGTCRMGSDQEAVVDAQLRFQGAPGLRIADASIMPKIIGANTNAASMMIGRRAAMFALGQSEPQLNLT